jgi:surface-anchored protein
MGLRQGRGWRRLAPVLGVALVAGACDLGEPPVVLDDGHVDGFAVAWEDGALDVHVHDDGAGVERDPAEAVLHAVPATRTVVPGGSAFGFLGAAGSDVWILPQAQEPGVLWLGWETEEIPAGVLDGNRLQWRLLAVEGPGAFHLFTSGSFGQPQVLFDSDDGLPDSVTVSTGTHAHGNWAFGAAGQYKVTFEATAVVDGRPVSSGPVHYTFTAESYECGDIDDVTVAPNPVAGGSSLDVDYQLANCGTAGDTYGIAVTVTAPAACGGGVQTVAGGPHTLAAGATVAGSVAVEAPGCAGTYAVKVKATGVPNSYADEAELTVT